MFKILFNIMKLKFNIQRLFSQIVDKQHRYQKLVCVDCNQLMPKKDAAKLNYFEVFDQLLKKKCIISSKKKRSRKSIQITSNETSSR